MSSKGGQGWSRGKILAVVIPLCVVIIGGVVALVLVLGRSDSGKAPDGGSEVSREELIRTYEELNREAEEAIAELERVAAEAVLSEDAASEPGTSATTYEQELEQLNATFSELEQEVADASAAVVDASGEVSETANEYQELCDELTAYYEYLEQLAAQAVSQVEYLQSVAPCLEDIEQYRELVNRLAGATPVVQRELSDQLTSRSQAAMSRLGGVTAPASMQGLSAGMNELSGQMDAYAKQVSSALASGNAAALNTLSNEIGSALAQTQQQLVSELNATFKGFSSQLASAGQKVNAAIP